MIKAVLFLHILLFLSFKALPYPSSSARRYFPSGLLFSDDRLFTDARFFFDVRLSSSFHTRMAGEPARESSFPEELEEQLKKFRVKDDLSGWVYYLIQWVAKTPSTRAGLLRMAEKVAWRNPKIDEEKQAWLDLLSNEGYFLLLTGDIVHSTDAYTTAFQWARQYREIADETQVLENILKPLGNNYTRLGDYEQALFIHRKALSIAIALEDKNALAGTYSNLANTTSNMGRPDQSLDYCRLGLVAAGIHSAFRGLLLSEQADACRQLQRAQQAQKSILESLSELERSWILEEQGIVEQPEAGYWLLTAYQQAGDIFLQQPSVALAYYQKALLLQQKMIHKKKVIRRRQQAKLCQRLGDLYFHMGQFPAAKNWLDQCLSVLIPGKPFHAIREADLFAENTLVDLLFSRASLYLKEDSTDKALPLYNLCFSTEKQLRNELVTGSSKERSVTDSRIRYEAAIGAAWKSWERTGSDKYRQAMLDFMESSKSRLLLEDLLQQQQAGIDPSDTLTARIRLLERALIYYQKEALQAGTVGKAGDSTDNSREKWSAQEKQLTWDLAALHKKARNKAEDLPGAAELAAVNSGYAPMASILTENQTIRSFFAGSTAIYEVEFSHKGIKFADRLPLSVLWQDSLRSFIQTYFGEGANKMIDQPRAYYAGAYEIYHQLFGGHPLEQGIDYIFLSDGALNLLPVEALVTEPVYQTTPGKWPFVIKQAQVSYAWSLRTLAEQIRKPGNKTGFSGFFLSGNTGHLAQLPAITREKESVARSVRKGNWFTDELATTNAFRTALGQSSIVHISSHAFSKKDTLDLPHLELYNEPYYVFESNGMEHHPSLLVLSACRTGEGRMVTGEGAQSLARGFTAGGTCAVIAGYWNVHDEAAAKLMGDFYSALASNRSAAAALREAKLSWIDDPKIPYLHKLPYYWAALQYQGNPDPLGSGFRPKGDGGNGPCRGPLSWSFLCWTILPLLIITGILFALGKHRRRRKA